MRWWPRTIRWQMLAGLLLLETLSIGLFAIVLFRQQNQEVFERARVRLSYEATSVALQSSEALLQNRPGWVGLSVRMIGEAPTVAFAKVTDSAGNVLFVSKGEADQTTLNSAELAELPRIRSHDPLFFAYDDRWESAAAIYTGTNLRGYAWVEYRKEWSREQRDSILRSTLLFGIIWIIASALLVLMMAGTISRPLAILQRGTRSLMADPESSAGFPLKGGRIQNEIGELIEAFNSMVASIAEQRSGLNDTLSLLDSMLANAPIGLAFFDRGYRFTRVNQVFADLAKFSPSRLLGRTLPEIFPPQVAQQIENAIQRVFSEQESMRSFEITGQGGKNGRPWTWLISAYPVRTTQHQIRWAGIIVLDASDRKSGKAGGHRAPRRVHCARNQQSAGGHHQPAVSAAQLLRSPRPCAQLRHHGRVRGAPHCRNHAANSAFLSPAHAAGAHQNVGSS